MVFLIHSEVKQNPEQGTELQPEFANFFCLPALICCKMLLLWLILFLFFC